MTADAYHLTAPHPEGLGACNVMKAALEDANMSPSDIDYINVHGTSTPLGDIAESKAILSVFGNDAYNLNISSTKSMTGHLLGGCGLLAFDLAIDLVVDLRQGSHHSGHWGGLLADGGLLTLGNDGETSAGQGVYSRHAGTSFAAPQVAGVVAMMAMTARFKPGARVLSR